MGHALAVVRSLAQGVCSALPDDSSLDSICTLLEDEWNRRGNLQELPSPTLRQVPFALFHDRDGKRLIDQGPLVAAYLERLARGPSRRAVLNLLHVFLLYYPLDHSQFEPMRSTLVVLLDRFRGGVLDQWKVRCKQYALLQPHGHRTFVRFLNEQPSVDSLLAEAGLTGVLATGGFLIQAYRCLLDVVSEELRARGNSDLLTRVFELSVFNQRLRFRQLRGQLADALLCPFGKRHARDDIRNQLTEFFMKHLGHPRLRPEEWQGSSSDAQAVMLQWLVSDTLNDFFELLDITAFDRHWRVRKAFWQQYLDKGVVLDAWIVLGPEARGYGLGLLNQTHDYGSLQGAEATQSVLLMRIDNLIIAEWSHNGRCRIWRQEIDHGAPELYKLSYKAWELRREAGAEFTHDQYGRWRDKVASYIEREAGIRHDGMP